MVDILIDSSLKQKSPILGCIEDENEKEKIKNVYNHFLFSLWLNNDPRPENSLHYDDFMNNKDLYLEKIKNSKKTFHLYEKSFAYSFLLENMKKIICEKIKNNMVAAEVYPINEMNELYISKIGGSGSDHIFESKHIDGPFFFLPYCYVYRCILGLSKNENIKTHFICDGDGDGDAVADNKTTQEFGTCVRTAAGAEIEKTINLNEYVAFDYNRTIHYISSSSSNSTDTAEELRVVYKSHYIVCPDFVPIEILFIYKWLHIYYNNTMRFLFINSQNDNILSRVINTGNSLFLDFFPSSS